MVRGALQRTPPFRRPDPRDRRWWLGLRLTLDALEADDLRAQLAAAYAAHMTLLAGLYAAPAASPAAVRALDDAAQQLWAAVQRSYAPWRTDQQDRPDAIARLAADWAATWGDPNDPATQARIDATVQHLRRLRGEAA